MQYFDESRFRRGDLKMKVSTLLLRLDELEYSRQGIVYCTLMDYLGLPFNKGKSLYDHKSGKIKTIRYYRKRRNYIDHHDYMYAALAYLRIQGEAVKDEASRKHPRLGKGIIIKTRFIMDIPMQMFNSKAQYRYYLSKLKMASSASDCG